MGVHIELQQSFVRDPAYLGVWAEPQVHHHDGDERQHLQHPAPSLSASVGSRGGSW